MFVLSLSLSSVCASCERSAPHTNDTAHRESPTHDSARSANHRVALSPTALANARVTVERVDALTATPTLDLLGTLEADPSRMALVGARVSGRVTAVHVALGDTVRVGSPLIDVDTVELHQVTNEYVTAIARARQTRDVLERARQTHALETTSTETLRRAEADDSVAQSTLHEAEEHLHFLGLRESDIARLRTTTSHGESRSVVRSPVSGRVSAVTVSVGQVVGAEQQIARVGSTDAVWLRLKVFVSELGRVTPGATVIARALTADGNILGRGTVIAVSDVLDPVTRTVDARVSFMPEAPTVMGANVRATVAISPGTQQWIPNDAIQTYEGRTVVFVRVGERNFEPRTVTLGETIGGATALRSGLARTDSLVVSGAFVLRTELDRASLDEDH